MTYAYHSDDNDYESIEEMNITDTANDAPAGGRSISRPSTTQRIGKLFRFLRPSQLEDQESLIQPDTAVQRRASRTEPSRNPEVSANLNGHDETKRKRGQKKPEDAKVSDKEEVANKAALSAARKRDVEPLAKESPQSLHRRTTLPPSLKRRANLETRNQSNGVCVADYMGKLRAQRVAIREGNLEIAIPPLYSAPQDTLPSTPPKSRKASPSPAPIVHKKPVSTTRKLISYIETGADIMDSTRRDITSNLHKSAESAISGKFRPPLAGIDCDAQGLGNGVDDSDDESIESFYCIGERRMSDLEKSRRLSGGGSDPWAKTAGAKCRLCQKLKPAGVRGLCLDCEAEFRQPKSKALNTTHEDDIKPTARQRIRKHYESSTTKSLHEVELCLDETELGVIIGRVDVKPMLVKSQRIVSERTPIEGEYHTPQKKIDYISKYELWQTPEMRAEAAELEDSRWSPRLLDDDDHSCPSRTLLGNFNHSKIGPGSDDDAEPLLIVEEEEIS